MLTRNAVVPPNPRAQPRAFLNLSVYWHEGQLATYLRGDPGRYQHAIQVVEARQTALNTLGNGKDEWDYRTLEECANMLAWLGKVLPLLATTGPRCDSAN